MMACNYTMQTTTDGDAVKRVCVQKKKRQQRMSDCVKMLQGDTTDSGMHIHTSMYIFANTYKIMRKYVCTHIHTYEKSKQQAFRRKIS